MSPSLFPVDPGHALGTEVCCWQNFSHRGLLSSCLKSQLGWQGTECSVCAKTMAFLETELWKWMRKLSFPDCHCSFIRLQKIAPKPPFSKTKTRWLHGLCQICRSTIPSFLLSFLSPSDHQVSGWHPGRRLLDEDLLKPFWPQACL